LVGDVRTHPYSSDEGGYYNMAFSSDDVSNLRDYADKKGSIKMVEAGGRRFALVILDPEKAKDFFKNNDLKQVKSKFKEAFDNARKAGKSPSQANSDAVRAVIGKSKDSGIGFYRIDDKKKLKFIQTNK